MVTKDKHYKLHASLFVLAPLIMHTHATHPHYVLWTRYVLYAPLLHAKCNFFMCYALLLCVMCPLLQVPLLRAMHSLLMYYTLIMCNTHPHHALRTSPLHAMRTLIMHKLPKEIVTLLFCLPLNQCASSQTPV